MMMRWMNVTAGALLLAICLVASPVKAEETPKLPNIAWSWQGLGTIDQASAQRGFQVYNEVCSSCHSLKYMSYRNLEGIGLSAEQVKAIAASKTVPVITADGGNGTRPALPSDHFVNPFANDNAARSANNGALPPDQSLLLSAREGHANYIYALLAKGYVNPPPDVKVPDGLYYNIYFPGNKIHMPPPLADNAVTYADGTKATVDQEARDVTTFLYYASYPETDQRKRLGVHIIGFLVLLTGVTYAAKRKLWANIH